MTGPRGRRANGEGSVWFDPARNKWTARLRLPNGTRPIDPAATEKEVRLELQRVAVDVARGLPIANNKLTLKRYLAEWMAGRGSTKNAARTRSGDMQPTSSTSARRRSATCAGQVQPRDVQALLREMRAKGLSERTVTYIHATLRVALADAVELDELPRNPALVSRRKGRKRGAQDQPKFKVQPLTVDQTRRLLETARGERLEVLFTLALATALRRGEMLGLRWQDVDLARRQLRVVHQLMETRAAPGQRSLELVPVKSDGSARIVDLPNLLVEQLQAHRQRQDAERLAAQNLWLYRDLVFCSEFGAGIETTTLYRVYKRVCERAGVHARLHDLRHTAASLLLAQGVPLWDVSKILGHASYQFTLDTYGHLYAETRRTAADAMDLVLRG